MTAQAIFDAAATGDEIALPGEPIPPGGIVSSNSHALAALIRAAKAKGCKFVISTDAHHPKHLANMSYGVRMARRGWLEAGDIVNTLNAEKFSAAIGAK